MQICAPDGFTIGRLLFFPESPERVLFVSRKAWKETLREIFLFQKIPLRDDIRSFCF